jgi:hypothetical protein
MLTMVYNLEPELFNLHFNNNNNNNNNNAYWPARNFAVYLEVTL